MWFAKCHHAAKWALQTGMHRIIQTKCAVFGQDFVFRIITYLIPESKSCDQKVGVKKKKKNQILMDDLGGWRGNSGWISHKNSNTAL